MLGRRPQFWNFVHYFISLRISCLKLTHSFSFFIAHGKFHEIVSFVFSEWNERFADD